MDDYLQTYQDLWWSMDDGVEVPMYDVAMHLIGENDYYGCDFTGRQQMIMLFFTGSSDYFPGIWVGNDNYKNNLDEYPIYVLDLSSENDAEFIGNFREYMTYGLTNFIKNNPKHKRIKLANKALKDLEVFSTKCINKGKYVIKVND